MFAPDPTRPRPLTCVCTRCMCAAVADARRICARSHASTPGIRACSHQPAPGPTRLRPLICVCARRVCAHSRGCTKSPRPIPRIRAWSPRPFLPVRARSHPPAPISTRSRPTQSCFYQQAHAGDRVVDQCAPTVISRVRSL
jgi:hypothetical protein